MHGYGYQPINPHHAWGKPAGWWSSSKVRLSQQLRSLWEQHVFWTRLTVNSIIGRLPDEAPTTARLLRNADDFGAVFGTYYGPNIGRQFAGLLREHLTIAAELVTALRDDREAAATDARTRWFRNADEIARFLGQINPYWSETEWRNMYREHLRLLTDEITYRLMGDYERNVAISDEIQRQALEMADMMTTGITRQFPGAFAY